MAQAGLLHTSPKMPTFGRNRKRSHDRFICNDAISASCGERSNKTGEVVTGLHRFIICVIFYFVLIGVVFSEEILLTCTGKKDHVFQLFPEKNEVRFVSRNDTPIGKLTITDNQYIFEFPRTKDQYETRVRVNRYTGKMDFDLSVSPFFKFHKAAECTPGPNKPKF